MAYKNKASLGVRVFETGIEEKVNSIKHSWEENAEGKYQLNKETDRPDENVAYADCVVIGYSDKWEPYARTLKNYEDTVGDSRKDRPKGEIFFTLIRLYWYPPESNGYLNENYGIRSILERIKDPKGIVAKQIELGDSNPDFALRILDKLKELHQSGNDKHLTMRADFERMGPRKFIRGMPKDNSLMWHKGKPGSLSNKKWVENIHGRACQAYFEHRENIKGTDHEDFDFEIDMVQDLGESRDNQVLGLDD